MASRQHSLPIKKRIVLFLGRTAIKAISRVVLALPERFVLRVGALLGLGAFRLSRRYRTVAIANLTQVFGDEWTSERIEETARDMFRNLGMSVVEFIRLSQVDPDRLDDLIEVHGEENIEKAKASGKGIIAITAHYGNFELFGAAFVRKGYPLSVIARDADDEQTNAIINAIRERMGYHVFPRQNAARQSLAVLRRNEVLGVLPDQNDLNGIFVPFFGRLASTAIGPAFMALHTGATLLPAFIHRRADLRHEVTIYPPIEYTVTGDRDRDIYEVTLKINQAIETAIRAHPEQWFWLHNRWKRRPPEELSPIGQAPAAVSTADSKPGGSRA